jgi:hypothetical protein
MKFSEFLNLNEAKQAQITISIDGASESDFKRLKDILDEPLSDITLDHASDDDELVVRCSIDWSAALDTISVSSQRRFLNSLEKEISKTFTTQKIRATFII